MKPITFLGDSRKAVGEFPDGPRYRAGVELRAVQNGLEPDDWKPIKAVGPGVREIRIRMHPERTGLFIWRRCQIGCLCFTRSKRKRRRRRKERSIWLLKGSRTGMPQMTEETFDNVFDALAQTSSEAANMTVRADLLLQIRECVRAWGLSQEQAASRLGITRPRLNDLLRGKIDKFSIDALINVAASAGLKPHIQLEAAKAA